MFLIVDNFNKVPYSIPPGRLVSEDDNTVFSDTFQAYLDEKEADILKKLLGLELYDEFIAGLDEDYPEQKWLDLRDGVQYTYLSVKYEWVGVIKMLTPLIFAMDLRDNYDNYSDAGISVGLIENAEMINPALRIVQAWNKGYAIAGNCNNPKHSLYGFLTVNKDADYTTWVFTDIGSMNRFNL